MPEPVQVNRRAFLTTVATATAVVISLPVLQAQAAKKPTPPDAPIDIGTVAGYAKDGITDKWAAKGGNFFVVRKEGKIYAVSSTCTHKFCPVVKQADEYYCKCHKSHFTLDGEVTEGPATKTGSLPHFAIKVDDKGHILVDASKEFTEAKWAEEGSFIKV